MTRDMDRLYQERMKRYVTALRNGTPDRVPIRPFAAEFCAKYAGYDCQQVTHDYQQAFEAVRKTAADFEWDAVVGNMVYVWTGLTEAIGLKYLGVPGITVQPDTGFQYLEPPEGESFMRDDEYDALIADPTGFLFNTWLPRVSRDVAPIGAPATYRNNLSFLKGGMAMLSYFTGFGAQAVALREEAGMPGAIAGILKAPLDIIGDKLRGYLGLTHDLLHQPAKVRAACEALAPQLMHIALAGADPDRNVPITIWMHRGCVPFVTHEQFDTIYWPTLKPIIEGIWARGHQVLFYAEGDWDAHLEAFAELPEGSIIYHVDRGDLAKVKRALGDRFCLSGGIPNYLLSYGTPGEVSDACKKAIDIAAPGGGYVMDASAIIQDDAKVKNVRALTETTLEHGAYTSPDSEPRELPPVAENPPEVFAGGAVAPGVCVPWAEKRGEYPGFTGDEALVQTVWENIDALAHMYAWHCLVSF